MLNSLIGIIASSGGAAAAANSYESIATINVGSGGSSTITFSSIPSTYQHLQIRLIGRVTNADTADNAWVRFNGDTGSNYSWHYLAGDGTSASASGAATQTRILAARVSAANAASGNFAATVIDILDYANTGKNKTVRSLTGQDRNGAGSINLNSGAWYNTAAVTSIDISNSSATDYVQYTQAALYGIKG
jgi:hypothetical protein